MSQETAKRQSLSSLEQVKQYHDRTKHGFNQYARSLGYLDWANQPDPFRRFNGAPLTRLPILSLEEAPCSPSYEQLFHARTIPAQPLTLRTLSRFFEYALSLTAWKEYGNTRWALRSNPSSGNLHPTEGYLLLGPVPDLGLSSGLYHYAPKEHALEQRWALAPKETGHIFQHCPQGGFLVGLSSIHWREAWKYGERAFRYCQHDTGHVIGTFRLAAATLGWNLRVLEGVSDDTTSALLGLSRQEDFQGAEREYPELLAAVWPQTKPFTAFSQLLHWLLDGSLNGTGKWLGTANRLSREDPVVWEVIDRVNEATWKPLSESPGRKDFSNTGSATHHTPEFPKAHPLEGPSAGQLIHQRRSAVAFDDRTSMPAARFFVMLERILPLAVRSVPDRPMPWDAIPWDPTVHLALFLHRIDGLEPGLYWFNRFPERRTVSYFQSVMHPHFQWTKPPLCPDHLPLYLLEEGNGQQLAKQLSCWQDIAADSAFSLGMIAEFDEPLTKFGPWFYKRLFWETGLIGQVLYLEAEASGVRATGIGCFFDNPVHEVLGFHPRTLLQSLYHFTVGGPLDDGRLTTLPPYGSHVT